MMSGGRQPCPPWCAGVHHPSAPWLHRSEWTRCHASDGGFTAQMVCDTRPDFPTTVLRVMTCTPSGAAVELNLPLRVGDLLLAGTVGLSEVVDR